MQYRSNNIMALIPPIEEETPLLEQTLLLRQLLGMRVFIYNIIKKPLLLKRIIYSRQTKHARNFELIKLREYVENIAHKNDFQHLSYRIKSGSPLPLLIWQSKKGGYEFLTVGKNGTGNILTKEDTDRLISSAFCPVMTISKKYHIKEIKNIIIPIDISQSTKKKLLWATYFAKKFNAKVTIVSALTLNIDQRRSLAWRNAEKIKHMLTKRGIESTVEIFKTKEQEKYKVIIDYINRQKPGMVIIRTHQKTKFAGLKIGKFVSEIIHNCPMPVFTVNRFNYPMPLDFKYNNF